MPKLLLAEVVVMGLPNFFTNSKASLLFGNLIPKVFMPAESICQDFPFAFKGKTIVNGPGISLYSKVVDRSIRTIFLIVAFEVGITWIGFLKSRPLRL